VFVVGDIAQRLAAFSPEKPVTSRGRKEIEYDDQGGFLQTPAAPAGTVSSDHAAILAKFDLDPTRWVITGLRRSQWEQKPGVELESIRCTFAPRNPDVATLDSEAFARYIRGQRRKAKPAPSDQPAAALCVVLADPQVGKTGSGGGTDELIARMDRTYDKLTDHIAKLKRAGVPLESAVWLDAGDIVENFENVPSQAQTNDRDITAQLEVAREIEHHGIDLLARNFARVDAATCGSNHAQVRRNGKRAGKPSDDFGIHIMRSIEWAYGFNADAYSHVSFRYPTEWSETTALDVCGQRIGLAHGYQAGSPDKVIQWWKGQSHGRQPVAEADVLVTGHWHHIREQQTGDGRMWLQAPNMDPGSDWWANIAGDNSPPGMLTFVVTPDGVDWRRVL